MALMDLAVTMFFVVWNFSKNPIFHCQSQFDAKMTSFRIIQVAIQKSFFAFRVVSRLIHVATNFPFLKPVQECETVC